MGFHIGAGAMAGDLSRALSSARILPATACAVPAGVSWSNMAIAGDATYPEAITSAFLHERGRVVDPSAVARADLSLGAAVTIDAVTVAAHDLGVTGAEISIEGEEPGGAVIEILGRQTVADNRPLLVCFPPRSLVSLSLLIHASGGAAAASAVGFFGGGRAVAMDSPSRWAEGPPAPVVGLRRVSTITSARREPLGMVLDRAGGSRSFSWPWLAEEFTRSEMPALRDALALGWFVIAERPEDAPGDTFLGWVSGDVAEPAPTGQADLHSWSLKAEIYLA